MGGQPSWQDRPDQRQSPQPTTISESSDVTPPADDETGNPFKAPNGDGLQSGRLVTAGLTGAREDEARREVFDLAKMSPHDIATELARRSKPAPSHKPVADEAVNSAGEHLTASGLSDAEVAAFFAPLPRLFHERREHDHADPAYAALRAQMTEAADDDAADDHDPMDALSKALETRLAGRPSVETQVLPAAQKRAIEVPGVKPVAAKKTSAAEKISALMEKSTAGNAGEQVGPEKLAVRPAQMADDFTIPLMPSQIGPSQIGPSQTGTSQQAERPATPKFVAAPQPFSAGLPESLMASPLHIPALSLSFEKDAVGLPQLSSRNRAADKAFIEPVLRKPAKTAETKLDIEQSIAVALAEKAPAELRPADLPLAEKPVAEMPAAELPDVGEAVPASFRSGTDLPPIIVDEPMDRPVKRAPIRLVKRSGKSIPVQSLLQRLPMLDRLRGQSGSFRWDVLAGGVVIGAVLAAIPVLFLMPSHAPVRVDTASIYAPDQVAAAAGAPASASPAPAQAPSPVETIVPAAPPVPTINTGSTATATDGAPPALTQEQADKLLQSAQSMSTAAGGTAATPGNAAVTTAAVPAKQTATTTAKPAVTTTKKPATTKKKTKPKPATTQQLSPAKR